VKLIVELTAIIWRRRSFVLAERAAVARAPGLRGMKIDGCIFLRQTVTRIGVAIYTNFSTVIGLQT